MLYRSILLLQVFPVRPLFAGLDNLDDKGSDEDGLQDKTQESKGVWLKLKDECLIAILDRFDQVMKLVLRHLPLFAAGTVVVTEYQYRRLMALLIRS